MRLFFASHTIVFICKAIVCYFLVCNTLNITTKDNTPLTCIQYVGLRAKKLVNTFKEQALPHLFQGWLTHILFFIFIQMR
jgi:hypothetical protein